MNFASKLRKVMTTTVAVATIASSMGLSALTASAATPATGSLIKASLPTVYFLGADSKRYVFPNQDTFKTWYADFSSVQTITDTELAALPLGGNVTMRPGVAMIKITTDPKVYAVSKGGVLRWIKTEAAAQALYGSDWAKKVKDVADSFFTNYTIGSDIASSADFMPATEMSNSASINVDKNLASGGNTTTVSGTMTATLSAAQPVSGYLPKGATGVTMIKVDVRNGGSTATTIDSITVARTGLGNNADFAALYVYEGANRLTTARSFTTSDDFTASGLNLSIAAGETKTLSIVADISGTATNGDVNSVKVVSVSSGSVVAAGLPIAGPSFTLSGSGVGQVEVTNGSTITAPKAGSVAAKVAEFKLENQKNVSSEEDMVINKVTLYYAGSITRTSLSNLVLKQSGTTLASVASLNAKDQAVFVLASPFALNKGVKRTFEVYADFNGTTRTGYGETLKFYVEETSDIAATGTTSGYGAKIVTNGTTGYDGSSCAVSSSNGAGTGKCSATYLDGGQLTMTFNGPSAGNITKNAKDVELFNFTMAAASNIEVKRTTIVLDSADLCDSTTVAYFTDIKMVDVATGATVTSSKELDCTGSQTSQEITYSDIYNLRAGQSKTMKVTADVANLDSVDGKYVTVSLKALDSNYVKNTDNNTNVSDIVPTGNLAGKKQTAQIASVTMTAASTPATGSKYVVGSSAVSMLGISLKAGDSTDVKLNALTVNLASSASLAAARNVISTAGLWNGSTQIGDLKSIDSSGKMVFSNLNLSIAKNASVTLLLKGNLGGSITGNTADYTGLKFEVAASTVDIVDVDNNPLSVASLTNGPSFSVISGGTVTVAKASDDTESEDGLVLAGGTNIALAKFKFNATNEEMKLSKARFTVSSLAAANVKSLSLYNGSTLVGAAVDVDSTGAADFSGVNFVIPKDGNATLTVKGELATIGSGIMSGTDVRVTLSNASGKLEIVGTASGSGTKLTESDITGLPLVANHKIVRKTKPTVSLVALPSSSLIASEVTVARFKVTADNMGEVSLKKITMSITDGINQTATLSGWKLRRFDTGTDVGMTATPSSISGTNVSGNVVFGLTSEETIAPNTSKTYDVIVTVAVGGTGLQTSDTLSAKVLGDTAVESDNIAANITGNLVWSDESAANHSVTETDWNNGLYVKGLPTDAQTLTK
jgi:hypothetical protein